MRERVARLSQMQIERLSPIQTDARFENVRQLGTITAFELTGHDDGYAATISLALRHYFLERGVLLRPLGRTIYVMPPYCTTGDELDHVYAAIWKAADEVTG